jgi:hypothetical protein
MGQFVLTGKGRTEVRESRERDLDDDPMSVLNINATLEIVARAERILFIAACGDIWLVKDRFEPGKLPLKLR